MLKRVTVLRRREDVDPRTALEHRRSVHTELVNRCQARCGMSSVRAPTVPSGVPHRRAWRGEVWSGQRRRCGSRHDR